MQKDGNLIVEALLLCLLPIIAPAQTIDQSVSFTRLESRHCVGRTQKAMLVIRNEKELGDLLRVYQEYHGSRRTFPKVDFRTKMLIALHQGRQPSSGYEIRVSKVVETPDAIKIIVEEISPGKSCAVQDQVTFPCDLVVLKRTRKRVEFVTKHHVKQCSSGD